ncbi:MAG: protein-methionine-sulfoxide reductase catalytic subunit MsrP [Planctomycetota bacterium]|nr:protein-methionine-sulfoxide reductase catalytic subunit MsrP [Planctomycetota bacterium]
MNYFVRRPFDLPQKLHTPYDVYINKEVYRREFLKAAGIGGVAAAMPGFLSGCGGDATDAEIEQAGQYEHSPAMQQAFSKTRAPSVEVVQKTIDLGPQQPVQPIPVQPNPIPPIVVDTNPRPVDPGTTKTAEPVTVATAPIPAPPKPAPKPVVPETPPQPENVNRGGIRRNPEFEYERPETPKRAALEFTNFYEFSGAKSSWQLVGRFKPLPWQVEVSGECMKPKTFDIDDIIRKFPLEERAYRHRCVETWAMCVPWIGFPLNKLLKLVEPKASANFVRFESFHRPDEAPGFSNSPEYPWPYIEGLRLEEAMNDLTLLTTGMFGEPLAKQNGAPIRIVTPWKYGFKCIKSIVKITLTSDKPPSFWTSMAPREYKFTANVDPSVSHPRWSQRMETMLGTGKKYPTKKYNGYGKWVGELYR